MADSIWDLGRVVQNIRIFNEERDWVQFHSPENLAKSVAIEAGELLECFQWSEAYKPEKVYEELADVMMYCIMLADKLGIDPKKIMLDKLQKNAEKYPVDQSRGSSKKYDELRK